MWYFKPKQYLQDTYTRSGEGIFMMGKNAANKSAVMPVSSASGYGSVQTSATGATFVALSQQVAGSVTIINNTGTTLEISKDGGTTKIQLPTAASFCVNFITDANQVSVRRADTSNSQVTAYYEWEL
jgi:hypothetical protein